MIRLRVWANTQPGAFVLAPQFPLATERFTDIHTGGPDGVFDANKVAHLFAALQGLELAEQPLSAPLQQAVA